MTITTIRKRLANYLNVADDKKLKAIYALVEDEIDQEQIEYSEEFKKELDRRHDYYKNGGKMISANEANKRIGKILSGNKK